MGSQPYCFVAMVIVASVLISMPQKVRLDIPDAEKANWTIDFFEKHEQLSHEMYEYIKAGEELNQHLSTLNTTNPIIRNASIDYLFNMIPNLVRHPTFKGIAGIIVDEAGKAIQRSNISTSNASTTLQDIQRIRSNFNYVAALQRSIETAKPLLEQFLQLNDSTLLIMGLNWAVEIAEKGISDPTVMVVTNTIIDEVSQGFNKVIATKGPGFMQNNATTIVMSVLMSTNIQRLVSNLYNITKPLLDQQYGGNPLYNSLTKGVSDAYKLWQDPNVQLAYKLLSSQYLKASNLTNPSTGGTNSLNMLMTFLRNMNVRSALEFLIGSVSTRVLLPYNSSAEEDKINDECYNDMIDFIDAAKQEKAWALKMLDSYGKIPSALAKGNINFLGSFDECVEIRSDIKANEVLGGIRKTSPRYPRSLGSRYCRVRIPIPKSVTDGFNLDSKGIPLRVTMGVCVPNTCTGKDLYGLLKLDAFKNTTSLVDSVDCSMESDVTQDLGAVITIIVLGIFAFLIFTGTFYVAMESRGVFEDNDKSANADSAYSNLAFTKENNDSKTFSSLNDIKVENGHTTKEAGKDRKDRLPANYVPHSESGKTVSDNSADNITDRPNGLSNGKASTKDVTPKQEIDARPPRQKKEGVLVRIVKAFSVQINAPKILTGKTGLNSIECIHGIRFFSITWIMLGHTYNYGLISEASEVWSTANFVEALNMIQRFTFQAVIAGGFSVDTFFMISGMLLAYIQLKQMAKLKAHPTGPKIGNYVFRYFFHRFWRLTPMYGMILLIFATLLPYFGSGPLWPNVIDGSDNCKGSWWTNILYINNIVKADKMCMGWTWFLSNDMQFYIVSLLLLFFLTLSFPLGLVVSTLTLLLGISIATWQEYVYNGNFFTMMSDGGQYWTKVYVTPWCRIGAYCVGIFLGIVFYKRPRKAFSKVIGFIGWTTATAVALALTYSTYSSNKEGGVAWTNLQNAFYEGLGRPVWALCVAWVVFACHNKMGGYVNSILSWKGLVPLSRLSYAAYLIHPMMMILHVYSKRSLVYLTDYDIIYLFLGHATMSYMGAFVVSIAFEAPFMALEKLIL